MAAIQYEDDRAYRQLQAAKAAWPNTQNGINPNSRPAYVQDGDAYLHRRLLRVENRPVRVINERGVLKTVCNMLSGKAR